MKSIYLDYAAATPTDPAVLKTMGRIYARHFHNPSALYLAARDARSEMTKARAGIAKWLGAKPAEIIFTTGATEANNLAISGIMRRYPKAEVLVSRIEHDSVLEPAKQYRYKLIPVDKSGVVDLGKLAKMVNRRTVLVSLMYVNNELGTIQPLREIRRILNQSSKSRKSKLPLYFHSDAAQATNLLDLHVSRLGVDLLTINGGKLYGPKQSGALYVKAGLQLQPLIVGGGQEMGLRSGTENLAAAAGLAQALDIAQNLRQSEAKRLTSLRQKFVEQLQQQLPSAIVNGSDKHQSPHLLNLTIPGTDNERLIMELDEAGIQAAAGSACSASDDEPSHVLTAIGLKPAAAQASLRFSFGRQTKPADIELTVATLVRLVGSNR